MRRIQDTKISYLLARCTLVLLLLFSSAVFAQDTDNEPPKKNELIHCLAQEELIIHERKYGGPLYKLNQVLINELISWNDIHLKPFYVQQVCSSQRLSPSVNLLRLVLLQGQEVFDFDFDQTSLALGDGLLAFQAQEIKSFIERMPKILFSYLADVKLLVSNPHCFNREIPEVQFFYDRFQYLETHLNVDVLIEDKEKLQNIFRRLSRLDEIIHRCKSE